MSRPWLIKLVGAGMRNFTTTRPNKNEANALAKELTEADTLLTSKGGKYIVEREPRKKISTYGKYYQLSNAAILCVTRNMAGALYTARRSNHPFNRETVRLRSGSGSFDKPTIQPKVRTEKFYGISDNDRKRLEALKAKKAKTL